jgi:hypothetical protein
MGSSAARRDDLSFHSKAGLAGCPRQVAATTEKEPTPKTFTALGSPLKGQKTLGAALLVS